jgi:hypothetical protein
VAWLLALALLAAQSPLDPALLRARSAWVQADDLEPKALEEFSKAWRAEIPGVRLVSSAQEADVIVALGAAHAAAGTYLAGGRLVIAQVPQDWTLRVRTRVGTDALYEDTEAIGAQRYGGLKALVHRLAARRKSP